MTAMPPTIGISHHWSKIENVAAFASARPVDGGTGAVYVLLGK